MTAIFHDMMHQELEDYVDDIVVKSKRREEHFCVLKRVFERYRAFKLRMNPLKCAFGVSSGKFLGFLVHSRGIDVDPAKAMAIATMRPPATVKELKSSASITFGDSSLDWHQSPLPLPSCSRRGKALSGGKYSRRPSKGYNK